MKGVLRMIIIDKDKNFVLEGQYKYFVIFIILIFVYVKIIFWLVFLFFVVNFKCVCKICIFGKYVK